MRKYYIIKGYWKDDGPDAVFEELVTNYDDEPSEEDLEKLPMEIFGYGWSEEALQEMVEAGEETIHEFVIISYEEYRI